MAPIIHEKKGFVQFEMENAREFMIGLRSVHDVENFVALSTGRPYPIFLDDGRHKVNGKSFMEMFCLVLTHPLRVTADCTDEEFRELYNACSQQPWMLHE